MSTAREDSTITMKTRKQKLVGTSVGAAVVLVALMTSMAACKTPGLDPNPVGSATAPGDNPSASASASPASPSTSPTLAKASSPAPTKPVSGLPTYTVAGFPSAANTGYPHGLPGDTRKPVNLTPYTGPMTITVSGTVIDSKDISGQLHINAKNVVIKNSRIRVANTAAIDSRNHDANLLIVDTEIDGQGKDTSTGGIALIGWTGMTLLRVNAHDSGDIVRLDGRMTIQDSWLHDATGLNGAQHNDVIQSTHATYVRILHNRLDNAKVQTSCILLKADLGSISDVVVDSNLLNGGGYAFYWYDSNDHSYRITNGKVTNNRWLRTSDGGYYATGGRYGPVATRAYELPQWSNNAWYGSNEPIRI
jgi:hypothetical protein